MEQKRTHSPTKPATGKLFFLTALGNFRRKREKLFQVFKWPPLGPASWQNSLGQLLTLAHSPHSRSWRLSLLLAPFLNVHTSVSGLGRRVCQRTGKGTAAAAAKQAAYYP